MPLARMQAFPKRNRKAETEVRPFRLLAAALALASCGCAHTEQTGSSQARDGTTETPQDVKAPAAASHSVTPKTETGHPPLAASPGELMKPQSVEKISHALASKGFLSTEDPSPTRFFDAIKAFQKSQGLAATGFADHETLMRLGINPKDVDKSLGAPDAKAAKASESQPTQ